MLTSHSELYRPPTLRGVLKGGCSPLLLILLLGILLAMANVAFGGTTISVEIPFTQEAQVSGYDENGDQIISGWYVTSYHSGQMTPIVTAETAMPLSSWIRVNFHRAGGDFYGISDLDYQVFYPCVNGQIQNGQPYYVYGNGYGYAVGFDLFYHEGDYPIYAEDVDYTVTDVALWDHVGQDYHSITLVDADTVHFSGSWVPGDVSYTVDAARMHVLVRADDPPTIHAHFLLSIISDCVQDSQMSLVAGGTTIGSVTIPASVGGGSVGVQFQVDETVNVGVDYQFVLERGGVTTQVSDGKVIPESIGGGEFKGDFYDQFKQVTLHCDPTPTPSPSPTVSPSPTATVSPTVTPTATPDGSPLPTPDGIIPPGDIPNDVDTSDRGHIDDVQGVVDGIGEKLGDDGGAGDMGLGSMFGTLPSGGFGTVTTLPLPLSVFNPDWPASVSLSAWLGVIGIARSLILWIITVAYAFTLAAALNWRSG